jgi:hypothetical protein
MADGPYCGGTDCGGVPCTCGGSPCASVDGSYTLQGGCCSWDGAVLLSTNPCGMGGSGHTQFTIQVFSSYDSTTDTTTLTGYALLTGDGSPCGAGSSCRLDLPGKKTCADFAGLVLPNLGGLTGYCGGCYCDSTAVTIKITSVY